MIPLVALLDLSRLDFNVLFWPLLFGAGAYLLLTAQPIGRPKPDLAERLRRLDVEARMHDAESKPTRRPIFSSRLLEAVLRPVLDDLGSLLGRLMARFGLTRRAELGRQLALIRPGVEPGQFFGEKAASALLGLTLFPLMNLLGIHPFGDWPAWLLGAGLLVGFIAPDQYLAHQLTARRTACLMELPTILDLLTIALSAGLALEQALEQVTGQSGGIVAQELQRVSREAALGQRTLLEAMRAMAERNGIPEFTSFTDQLVTSYQQGTPLVVSCAVQAESLREKKRLRLLEEGGKASVRMILPVALFILPVLFVVLLLPAAVQLLSLGG